MQDIVSTDDKAKDYHQGNTEQRLRPRRHTMRQKNLKEHKEKETA